MSKTRNCFRRYRGKGKSYHISNVSKYLKRKRIDHIKIYELGGSYAEKIRKLILNNKSDFNKNTDLLLYLAARSENIERIKKQFRKKIILIDRFIDSTVAYQHYGLKVNLNLINIINKHLLKNFKVDFTFLNIVNKPNMIKRLKLRKRLNRYDKFDYNFIIKFKMDFLSYRKEIK